MSGDLVAVYGSLRSGQPNNHILKGCRRLGKSETVSNATLYNGGYFPYAALEGEKPIVVEVYEVHGDTLRMLDYLEGYRGEGQQNHFDRSLVEVLGFNQKAYLYHVDKELVEHLPVIESGDWFVK